MATRFDTPSRSEKAENSRPRQEAGQGSGGFGGRVSGRSQPGPRKTRTTVREFVAEADFDGAVEAKRKGEE